MILLLNGHFGLVSNGPQPRKFWNNLERMYNIISYSAWNNNPQKSQQLFFISPAPFS